MTRTCRDGHCHDSHDPESIEFLAAADSPNGNPLLLVGNEVSGTINVFEITVLNTGN